MVRSPLDYCWAPCNKGDVEALEKVQIRATKILPALRHLAYVEQREHLKACKLMTLHTNKRRYD